MAISLRGNDPRLNYFCPQPVDRSADAVRLERFPRIATETLTGQIGPSANLRSSAGCAVLFQSDSPWVDVHLTRLRHHQPFPQSIALEVGVGADRTICEGADLRAVQGDVVVRLTTGCERGGPLTRMAVWLPPISTCAVGGITLADGARIEPVTPPKPGWLAIGDSLTQGFSVQSPQDTWVHRVARSLDLPVWNLGIGGVKIEPDVFRWALDHQRWDVVTIGLGSNHVWRESDAAVVGDRAAALAELALAGGHRRVVWILPPWKPCEDGKGPSDFQGIPLGPDTGERVRQVREQLRQRLSAYAPHLELTGDHVPPDVRLLPDGLHPGAHGSAIIAERLIALLGQVP
ncbi:MAG: SGNH/GDSL hydrolase family protein [Planctomycetota bacterium]